MPVSTARVVVSTTGRGAWLRHLERTLQLLYSLSVFPHNVADVSDTVEVELEVVDLRYDGLVSANLRITVVDHVASLVVHCHGHNLGLLR